MPDITQRIGLDSLDQRVLEQSSKDRFDKLFGGPAPTLPNPNQAFNPLQGLPVEGYNPALPTPGQAQIQQDQKLPALDDETTKRLKDLKAVQLTDSYMRKTNPFYAKGLGETKYLPYKPLEKYLDESMGFKPIIGAGVGEMVDYNEDAYASIKNTVLTGIGKFFGRLALGAVAKAGQGIAYTGGLLTGWANPGAWYDMLVNNEDYLTASGDNVLSKAFEYMDDDVKNDWMPVYQEASSKGQGFWYRLTHDGSFWMNDISDGAAFALSAFVPALAASKLGLGARAVSALAKTRLGVGLLGDASAMIEAEGAIGATKFLQNANRVASFVDKSTVTVANTISESYFESRETYNTVYNKLIDQGVNEYEAKQRAQDAAKGTFWANIPALLFSNAFETKLQFQALGMNKIDDAIVRGVRQATPFAEYAVTQPTTRFGKFLASPLGFYAKKLPEAIAKEGYWEENIQQAIQRYYQNTDNRADGIWDQIKGIGSKYLSQTVEATMGRDPETSISIGLGGLIGAGHAVISAGIANQYKKDKEFRDTVVKNMNDLQDNWKKYGDPYERNENGDIKIEEYTKEDGAKAQRPVVNIPRLLAYQVKINDLAERLKMTDDVKNEFVHGFMKDALFSELVLANVNAGTIDSFVENLKKSKTYSEEDLAKVGIKRGEGYAQEVDRQLAFVDKVKNLDKSINNDVLFKRVKDKADVEDERGRHRELLRNGVISIMLNDKIDAISKEMMNLEGKINSKYAIDETDMLVKQLNGLESQIRYNEQFVKHPDFDSADIGTATKLLEDLQKERDKVLEDNEDLTKNLKKGEDDLYKYENQDRERDPEYVRYKKLQNVMAQMKNSDKVVREQWYKLADINKGLDYFRSDRAEKQAEAERKFQEQAAKDQALSEAAKENPFLKYREAEKGDFDKVSKLVMSQLMNYELSEEEKNLADKYADLIHDLTPIYAKKFKEIRIAQLEAKIKLHEELRDKVLVDLIEAKRKLGSLERQAEEIIQDYKNADTSTAKKKLQKVLKTIQSEIDKIEDWIEKNEPKLAANDNKIELARQELEGDPSIMNLVTVKEVIEKEKKYLRDQIEETKSLINRIKALIRELVRMAKELFVTFDMDTMESRTTYDDNIDKGRHEALAYEGEILTEAAKLNELRKLLKSLELEFKGVEDKLSAVNEEIARFKNEFNNFTNTLKQASIQAAAKELSAKPAYTDEEKHLNKIYEQLLGSKGPSNVPPYDRNIYDGDGYLRNLEYVFQASTDPEQFTGTPRTEGHLEFLTNVAQMNIQELNKKLKGGTLETFLLTAHNIQAFGMEGMVDPKYLDVSNPATAGIYIVYVLKRGNDTFFVDKDLNELDKVGSLSNANKAKVVFTSLRAAEYRDSDFIVNEDGGKINRYTVKGQYNEQQVTNALDRAIKMRQQILEDSKKVSPTNLVTRRFTITRGIPNRSHQGTEDFTKNPVTEVLIHEEDIHPDSITVGTPVGNEDFEKRVVGGITQNLPAGRPLLVTRNSIYAQHHYLDNNVLSDPQKQAVKYTLYQLAKEFSEALDKLILEANKGVAVEKDSPQYLALLGQVVQELKAKNYSLLNMDYIKYLNGVLFFRKLDEKLPLSAANERQIWFRGNSILLGNTGASLTLDNPEYILNSPELDNFLANYHHNYNALPENKRDKTFTEYYVEGGKLLSRQWPTYNHYLLSAKFPDGSKRFDIPLTTNLKTRNESAAERRYEGVHYPYIQRASVLTTEIQEAVDKKRTPVVPTSGAKTSQGKASVDAFNALLASQGNEEEAVLPEQTEKQKAGAELLSKTLAAQQQQQQSKRQARGPLEVEDEVEFPSGKSAPKTTTRPPLEVEDEVEFPTAGKPAPTTAQPTVQTKEQTPAQPTPPAEGPINPVTGKPSQTSSVDPIDPDAAADLMNNLRVVVPTDKPVKTESNINAVIADIKRMLPQIDVELLDRLINTTIGRQAWGQWTGAILQVYKDAEEGTAYHEAFEALVNSLLTNREWNALAQEFRSRQGTFVDRESGKQISYKDASQHQIKEELAEEFRDFKLTGRKWSGEKLKMNWFQRILKFITDFVFGLNTIEQTFAKLDAGLYGKRAVSKTVRFQNNYRLQNVEEAHRHKLMQGATALMFNTVFLSNKSFTDLDESIDEVKLYNDLRKSIQTRYEKLLTQATAIPEGHAMRAAIIEAYRVWTVVNDQWDTFVDDHKTYLRQYNIKFVNSKNRIADNEEEQLDDRGLSNQNRNDYTQSMMVIDAKKTSATSIRLLFATLVNVKFSVKDGLYEVDEAGMPKTRQVVDPYNQMFLPELINYDEIVKKVFNEFTGLNNLSRIEQRLREVSGIELIQSTPNVQAVMASLDNTQAALVSLYSRIFGEVGNHTDESSWKMKVKYNNFLAKQNPNPELMITTDKGEAYFIESNAKEDYRTLRRDVNNHIREFYAGRVSATATVPKGEIKFFKVIEKNSEVYYQYYHYKMPELRNANDLSKAITKWFGLENQFTPEFINSLSREIKKGEKYSEYDTLFNLVNRTLDVISKNNAAKSIKSVSLDGFGVEGRVKELINFYTNKTTSGTESSFLNIDNKQQQNYVLNNYMSRILSDLNNSKTKEEFIQDNPHATATFSQDSIVMGRMFDENGDRSAEKLQIGYTEGFMNASTREGQKNSSLSFIDRILLTFNSNLNGTYYTLLPADSETEWHLKLGEFVEYSNKFESTRRKDILDILDTYLLTEIKIAQEDKLNSLQQTNNKYSSGTRIADSLRIFKDILGKDPKLLKAIEKGIKDLVEPAKILADNKKAIESTIMTFINDKARKNFVLFQNQSIVQRDGLFFKFNLLNGKFAEKLGVEKNKDGGYFFTEDHIMDVFRYHAINYFIANMEMFKIFFGDPAQYKDLTKRIKSFTSGVEWSYYEKSEERGDTGLNGFLNTNKNNSQFVDKEGNVENAEINDKDLFHYRFSNNLNLLVVQDLKVVDTELYNQLVSEEFKDLIQDLAKSADTYAKINEADAQSATDIQTYREIMIKSGWRWSDQHEKQYQFEMAYARNRMAAKGKYKYTDDKLKAMDDKILESHPTPPTYVSFTPLKPLYAGVDNNDQFAMRLLKTSIFPITYRLAEGREMEDLYSKMLHGVDSKRVNIFTFESSQKVGLTLDANKQITPVYDPNRTGVINDFTKAKTPVAELSYKHFGIQVETQSHGYGNTLGTQLTKDIKLNLFEDGAPIDYLQAAMAKGLGRNDAIAMFYRMTVDQKISASDSYRLYREHEIALQDLKTAGYQELLIKIGAKEIKDAKGNISYQYKDLTKVRDIILEEMLRRELDENTIDSVQLKEDLQAFNRAPESMPSYDIIRNILYALVDKAILSPKVNGKPYIQVASSFFNSDKRQAAYFDKEENKWVTIKTEREHNQAVKAKRKLVYTSSELGFYKLTKDGKEVEAMEIMLPHIYKSEINDKRKAKGQKPLSDQEIIQYLEKEQPRLLEGIGFRIPTQATSSVEFFKIKGFLPETFGTAVVVPSAITAKAGSDFDVDKLNTYLNNWDLDKNGLPYYIEFLDDKNSTVKERYNKFIERRYKEVLKPIRQSISKLSKQTWENSKAVKQLEKDLDDFEALFTKGDPAQNKFLAAMLKKTISDMQTAMKSEEELRSLELEGEALNVLLQNAQDKFDENLANIHEDLPLETFKGLSPAIQNSKEALENRYFQSIRSILSMPYNFQFLLSPNSDENLKQNRRTVRAAELGVNEAEYKEKYEDASKDINHSQFLDFEYMNTQRHYFVRGKQDIGVFAVAMTNYANAQITGLVISPINDIRKDNEFALVDLNAKDFRLPFNYNTIKLNGVDYISLSARFDTDGKSIMDKISGYINGAVDVAKDPIIMDMGMLSELASVYILLERIGVAGEDVALFMKQPIIRDYIHEQQVKRSAIAPKDVKTAKEIATSLIDEKYNVKGRSYAYEHKVLSRDLMKSMLRKAAKASTREMIGTDFTQEERRAQQLVLANYMKLSVYASHLLETIQSSNHDTSNIRNNHVITRKNWLGEEVTKGNVIKSLATGVSRDGSTAIKEGTFVGNDVNILNRLESLYGPNIFTLQKANPARLIKFLGKKIYRSTKFEGPDAFDENMRRLEVNLLDYLAGNANILNNPKGTRAIKDAASGLFRTVDIVNGIEVPNKNSLESQYNTLIALIEKAPADRPHPLATNLLLNRSTGLKFVRDKSTGISTFEILTKPKPSDIYTKDRLTEAFRILRDNETSAQFYRSLVIGAIIQNGVGFSRNSINNLIPNEDYGAQLNEGLKPIDTQDFSNYEEILARTDIDHTLVDKPKVNQFFYAAFEADDTMDMFKTQYIRNPVAINKNYFNKQNVPSAVFLYGGKKDDDLNPSRIPNFFTVDMIHPDYILDEEDGVVGTQISPEVAEMSRKGDYSFLTTVLFKKVGLAENKVYFVEAPTKEKGTNLMVMYKPVNYWGTRNFKEKRNVYRTDNGEWIGEASILKDRLVQQEMTDLEIIRTIDPKTSRFTLHVTDDPTNIKNEMQSSLNNPGISVPSQNIGYTQQDIDDVMKKMDDDSKPCNE